MAKRDMKHLTCRNGIYGIDCRIPKDSGLSDAVEGLRIRQTLRTDNYQVAARIRDTTIVPLLATASKHAALAELVRQLCAASTEARDFVAKLAAAAEVDEIAGIRSAVFDRVPLGELVAKWCDHLNRSDLAAASKQRYQTSINIWLDQLGTDTDAQTIDPKAIAEAKTRLLKLPASYYKRHPSTRNPEPQPGERTVSASTVNYHLIALSKFFQWAIENRQITTTNPAAKIRAEAHHTRERRMPSLAEADALCSMPYNSRKLGMRCWQAIPTIMRYSGLRVQEAAGLRAEDIVTQMGIRCISVNEDYRRKKTKSATRLVPVADQITPLIDKLLDEVPTGRLFPKCGDQKKEDGRLGMGFSNAFNRAAKQIHPELSTHCLRKYAHDKMIEAEVNPTDARRILGHADKSISAVYTSRSLTRYQKAINRIREMEEAEISRDQNADNRG